MNLSEEEKIEAVNFCIEIFNSSFTKYEKEVFNKYLKVIGKTDIEFFMYNLGFIYENNNHTEVDIIKLIPFTEELLKSISEEEKKIVYDFFLLTPSIISIYAELFRREGALYPLLYLYEGQLIHYNKIIDRFFLSSTDNENIEDFNLINLWKANIKERIADVKEQIEIEQIQYEDTKLIPTLIWNKKYEGRLNKISKKLYKLKLTNKPLSFEKVFKKNTPTEWKGTPQLLAHLLYSINQKSSKDTIIEGSDNSGYMKTALFYFTNCDSKFYFFLNINLNDLSYKVRNSEKKYAETKYIVDEVLKDVSFYIPPKTARVLR